MSNFCCLPGGAGGSPTVSQDASASPGRSRWHRLAKCDIEIDGKRASVSASDLSDALDELSRAVVEVLRGEEVSRASFDEEPGEYRWVFQRRGIDRVRVNIIEFDELWANRPDVEGRSIFDAECRLRTLAGALLSELQRLFTEHGPAGYETRWAQHPFPARRIDQLKSLLDGPADSSVSNRAN